MRILVSKEKEGKIERSYQIQGIELEAIKKLEIPMPDNMKEIVNLGTKENLEKFYNIHNNSSFEFITNQYWMVNEEEVVSLNLFELEKTIEYLITERERIIESIRRIGTRDELEEIKVDLILNDYRTKSFKYLIKIKEKENKNKRK